MTKSEEKLKIEKLKKEVELLSLEIKNFDKKGNFLNNRISILIAIATLIISGNQIILSSMNSHKELEAKTQEDERRYELDLVNFIVTNQAEIFSKNDERREKIRSIMYVTFPEKILSVAFRKLERAATDQEVQQFWRESKKLNIGLEQIDTLLQITDGQREKIKVELWANQNKGQRIGELLTTADYQVIWVNSNNETPINSIWYDDDTSIENVKLIAMFMINSGVDIKQIKKKSNTRGHTQIGSEPFFVKNPKENISQEEIMKL